MTAEQIDKLLSDATKLISALRVEKEKLRQQVAALQYEVHHYKRLYKELQDEEE